MHRCCERWQGVCLRLIGRGEGYVRSWGCIAGTVRRRHRRGRGTCLIGTPVQKGPNGRLSGGIGGVPTARANLESRSAARLILDVEGVRCGMGAAGIPGDGESDHRSRRAGSLLLGLRESRSRAAVFGFDASLLYSETMSEVVKYLQ